MLMILLKHLKRARLMWLEEEGGSSRAELERDPLSHPALGRMSLEQLADLPFERHATDGHPQHDEGIRVRHPNQDEGSGAPNHEYGERR
jgi:hypothetical protein